MVRFNGKFIPYLHTVCAITSFVLAFAVGYTLHYHQIVENSHYSYPDEWFPSVSATIGDEYPERALFQILIAVTSFPRFLLLIGHYYLNGNLIMALVGFARTVSCGGWIYITSTDDHLTHNVFMFAYIILTLPWDIFVTAYSKHNQKNHAITASIFFIMMVPLIYWFIQHEIHVIAGAYSIYSFFEWTLIFLDISFDHFAFEDFKYFEIEIKRPNKDERGVWFYQLDSTAKKTVKSEKSDLSSSEKNDGSIQIVNKDKTVDIDDDEIKFVFEGKKLYKVSPSKNLIVTLRYDSLIYMTLNTINAFFFWSNLTALACTIWHFPLWYMGISGYEATALGYMGAIILACPFVPTIIYQYGTLIGNLIALGAYLVDVPENRIMVICVGVIITMATFTLNLKSISSYELNASFGITWVLGLVLSVVMKFGFYSNNPVWPIMRESTGGLNKSGLIVASVIGLLAPIVNSVNFTETKVKNLQRVNVSFIKKFIFSICFGSLIFAIHQLVTDSSTVIFWAWEGYNNGSHGPLAYPWSALTCGAMVFAATTALFFISRIEIPALLLIASTGVMASPDFHEWDKFLYGGLPYVISIIWFIPFYLSCAGNIKSLWVFVLSTFIYFVFIVAHVYPVAYAFVPFGWVLRERLHYILVASSVLIIFGALVNKSSVIKCGDGIKLGSHFYRNILFLSTLTIALIAKFLKDLEPLGEPEPYLPDSKIISAGIWTIHFGLDNDMWASEDRMIELIKDMELDVFGILESDTQRITMGNRDLTAKMAHDLNMYADFGPGPNKHTWGCALFSKFPIINSTHYLLPSPVGELAPAIHATLLTYDDLLVDVFVFHSGQEEDPVDRRLQSLELARLMGETNRPTILLSYLVTDPHQGNYNNYVSELSGMHDIDPTDEERWCEYILYKNIKRVGYARVARGTITDTELQVGKFQVLNHKEIKKYGKKLYEHKLVEECDIINEDFIFPSMFLDDGERGHFYHVLDEPRYYHDE